MLNIPDSVKALYKQDGVWKNFRAHFPGGELPDITNDNIVMESVKFTESICSQDVFKFGLAEASVIEFETVGIGNMYGMTIECSSEIDCSSLSAAEKPDIAAGTWDGTWDSENEVFSVPYGTFRVEECPRDHQAMAHRQVKAFTMIMTDTAPFEQKKDALMMPGKKYKPNIDALVFGQIARKSERSLLNNGYTKTQYTITKPTGSPGQIIYPTVEKTLALKDASNNTINATFQLYMANSSPTGVLAEEIFNRFNLHSVDYKGMQYNDTEINASLVSALETAGVDATKSGYSSLAKIAQELSPSTYKPAVWYTYGTPGDEGIIVPANKEIFYPWRRDPTETREGRPRFYWIYNASILFSGAYSDVVTFYTQDTPPDYFVYTPASTAEPITLTFDNTLDATKTFKGSGTGTVKKKVFSFADAFSAVDIANGFLEISAQFARATRSGGYEMTRISGDSPIPVTPGEYMQMWWDEYDVEPIGTVRYSYTDDAGEDQIVDFTFGNGGSVYDMTDNALLKAMDDASQDVIEAILTTYFTPNLESVNFTPIDMEMKGLPYIEAGDAITVTAQDGTVCNSYVLRQTQTGVQALRSQVDSQSGLIIDSEEA